MADKIRYAVSVTPVEEITDEQANTHEVISGEVGKSLGGSGEAPVANYTPSGGGEAAKQGYFDATVNYFNCVDDSPTQIAEETTASFVFIKNTGYLFNSITALGDLLPNNEHVVVTTVNTGTTIIASLGKGEVIVLKALQSTKTIDCTKIKVQTFESNGSAAGATDHIAVEYLVVD